jgi:hypothetical protein
VCLGTSHPEVHRVHVLTQPFRASVDCTTSLMHSHGLAVLGFSPFPLQLPKLEDTLRRYLDSASAVISPAAFEETKKVVAAFGISVGPQLHGQLSTLRDTVYKDSSYISEMWYVCA